MPEQPLEKSMMAPDVFQKAFTQALSDKTFRSQIAKEGFPALERAGFKTAGVPRDVQALLMREGAIGSAKPKCGVCGVCGACGLCGGADAGSASAAIWALFGLALTTQTTAQL